MQNTFAKVFELSFSEHTALAQFFVEIAVIWNRQLGPASALLPAIHHERVGKKRILGERRELQFKGGAGPFNQVIFSGRFVRDIADVDGRQDAAGMLQARMSMALYLPIGTDVANVSAYICNLACPDTCKVNGVTRIVLKDTAERAPTLPPIHPQWRIVMAPTRFGTDMHEFTQLARGNHLGGKFYTFVKAPHKANHQLTVARVASIMRSQASMVGAMGFSQKTCLPARAAEPAFRVKRRAWQ